VGKVCFFSPSHNNNSSTVFKDSGSFLCEKETKKEKEYEIEESTIERPSFDST
jgi:hypothetical protein